MQQTIPYLLDEFVETQGEAPAIITQHRAISFKELATWVEGTTENLKKHDIFKGDRIGICIEPSFEYIVLLLSLLKRSAIIVPLNLKHPFQTINTNLKTVQAKYLITEKSTQDYYYCKQLFIKDLVQDTTAINPTSINLQNPATVIFTSGSSGAPKAVIHSLANHYYSALGSQKNIPLKPGDRWLLTLPLFHVSGLSIFFRCFFSGATLVLPNSKNELSTQIIQNNITHLSLVSTQLQRLLETHAFAHNLQAILLGGSAIPPSLIQKAHNASLPIFVSYGLTEMASQVATTQSDDSIEVLRNTAGKILPYRKVKIGNEGEIFVSGKTLFLGYWHQGKLQSPFDKQGFFATKDIGYIDSDNNLVVQGRKDNMFISGGENIHPEAIEKEIRTIRQVKEVVVVATKDDQFGFKPIAFIKAKKNTLELESLEKYLRTKLPSYMIPKHFHLFSKQMPKIGIKIDRKFFEKLAISLEQSSEQ